MTIQQDKIRKIRERTGHPYVECQRALAEADGDVDRAVDLMRLRGERYTVDAKKRFDALIKKSEQHRGEIGE